MARKTSHSRTTETVRPLVADAGNAVRRMGAQSVITSEAIAGKFGLYKTDLESLDILFLRGGACSPGDLGQATGLTSGSVTALIDRLEKAGYVARERDSQDRRRQAIRIQREAIRPIEAVYQPMQAAMFKLWSEYSDRDLKVVIDFLERSTALSVSRLEDALKAGPPTPRGARKVTTRRKNTEVRK